jgi:hypothetical protein
MKKSNLILNLVLKEEIPPRLETVSDSQLRIKLHRVATHEAFSGEVKYKCTLVSFLFLISDNRRDYYNR